MSTTSAAKHAETWQYKAWRLWCAGNRNKLAIHRALQAEYPDLPKDPQCITRAIKRESKIARTELDNRGVDPLSEYIAGLEEDFGEADRLLRSGDNANARLGGLKLKVTLRQLIAAAKGVVTERKAEEITGANGEPLIPPLLVDKVLQDEQATELAAALVERVGYSQDDASGTGDSTQPGELETCPAPEPA